MTAEFQNVAGLRTHVQTLGEGKKVLVMLHGWGASGEKFTALAEKLLAQNSELKIVLPDLPGFGKTQPPEASGWTTHQYAAWLRELLQKISSTQKNAPVALYGHSFGCRVIVRLLTEGSPFDGKVILTGAAGVNWPLNWHQKFFLWLNHSLGWVKKIVPDRAQQFIAKHVLGARDWVAVAPEMKQTLAKVLKEEDVRDDLPHIQNKTLLLWGAEDNYTPVKSAHVFAEKLPHAELVIFPDGRHGIHHTHTEEIAVLVDRFLRES
ncbi:MAG: alpha/beta hydrolase [Candidatus Gracilibacteria bacterium]|nr:alpha/beta hydrolase [Candidatus Gracilibacteria bacterium]